MNLTIPRRVFVFNTKKRKYIVEIDVLDCFILIIKFSPSDVQNQTQRYRGLTKDNHSVKIFSTVVAIMVKLLEEQPRASFTFIGVPTLYPDKTSESIIETSRFRRYRELAFAKLGADDFKFLAEPRCSGMFIMNKNAYTNGGSFSEEELMLTAQKAMGYMVSDLGIVPELT